MADVSKDESSTAKGSVAANNIGAATKIAAAQKSVATQKIAVRHFAGHASHVDHFDSPVRVVHLTDQHVGRITSLDLQFAAVDAANAAAADVVLLTGDFVCHSQEYLEDLAEVIRRFQAPVFCVLGNHDHWSGAQVVAKTLMHAGAEVLRNQWTSFDVRGQHL